MRVAADLPAGRYHRPGLSGARTGPGRPPGDLSVDDQAGMLEDWKQGRRMYVRAIEVDDLPPPSTTRPPGAVVAPQGHLAPGRQLPAPNSGEGRRRSW